MGICRFWWYGLGLLLFVVCSSPWKSRLLLGKYSNQRLLCINRPMTIWPDFWKAWRIVGFYFARTVSQERSYCNANFTSIRRGCSLLYWPMKLLTLAWAEKRQQFLTARQKKQKIEMQFMGTECPAPLIGSYSFLLLCWLFRFVSFRFSFFSLQVRHSQLFSNTKRSVLDS